MDQYISPYLRRVSCLRHPATPIVVTVLLCYFFYPSWKLLNFSPKEFVIAATVYMVLLTLLLRLAMWTIHYLDADKMPPENALKPFEIRILAFVGLCAMLGHFSLMSLPILSGPDESVHVAVQMWQFDQYQKSSGLLLLGLPVICLFLGVILSFLALPAGISGSVSFSGSGVVKKLACSAGVFLLVFLLFYLLHKLLAGGPGELGHEYRWPPFGTVLSTMSLSIFGVNEFGARFPSNLFYLGTGYYVYRILRGSSAENWKIGICGVVVCFCCPLFFSYGHLDYRDMGGAFFLTLGMYYLGRYLFEGSHQHLLIVAFAIIAGFLQRRPVAIMLFIAVIFILVYCLANKRWWADRKRIWMTLLLWLTLCASIGLAILPWLHITRDVRPYNFLAANLLNFTYATAYMRILPQVLSWPITVLFCLGFLVSLIKRSLIGLIACTYLAALYLLFTCDRVDCIPTYRFTILFIPFLAIVAANFLKAFSGKTVQSVLLSCIVVLSLSSQVIWHSDGPTYGVFPAVTDRFSSLPYYPFDNLVKSIRAKDIPHGTIIYPAFWQTSSPFYYRMNNITGYREINPGPGRKRTTSMPALKEYCDANQCTALILRLKKGPDGNVGVKYLPDTDFAQVKENRLDDFHVEEIYFNRNKGLALLLPK